MAGVLRPSIDWNIRSHPLNNPVNTSKSGFGFGLAQSHSRSQYSSPVPSFATSSSHENASPARATKRRLEVDHLDEPDRDDSMDRSPTPERPKRAAPKRVKVAPTADKEGKNDKDSEGRRNTNDIDIGMLLASLPQQSYLPLLTELITKHPSIKPLLLPLIPRPTLQVALQALEDSAKILRDAYPYSNISASPSPFAGGTGFGFGSSVTPSFGFAPKSSGLGSTFGSARQTPAGPTNGGMRESYIQSRLRPHIDEFVSTAMSYIHYFSLTASTPVVRAAPPETYTVLAALATHILSQPPLAQNMLTPLMLPRLVTEWRAWLDRIDTVVNREGGMFGSEAANTWSRGLDQFAEVKVEGWEVMRQLRDAWVSRVGWLVGRSLDSLEMEEEL